MKFAASLVCLALLLSSCQTTPILSEKNLAQGAQVRGMVFDWDRLPASLATVTLTQSDGSVLQAQTDIHGRYALPNVPFGLLRLRVDKPGYESASWEFTFTEASQISYSQISNAEQLAEQAVNALEKKDWAEASALVTRAEALASDGPTMVFLRAFLLAQQGEAVAAVALLEGWLDGDRSNLTLELYAADLYDRALDNPKMAVSHWKRALAIRADDELEAKVREREKSGPK